MNMAGENDRDRISLEIELLKSIYPDEVSFNEHLQDLTYINDSGKIVLRLPTGYPSISLPEVVDAATKGSKGTDLRSRMMKALSGLPVGEEALDAAIASFNEMVDTTKADRLGAANSEPNGTEVEVHESSGSRTVIIWLHHLLNTSKRKQSLAASDPTVSGISKPGYPGVLIFSGPKPNVDEHVNGLKQLNWAAFQVRFEEDTEWHFEHGTGVIEVEGMKDVVREVGEGKKDVFLEVMKIK